MSSHSGIIYRFLMLLLTRLHRTRRLYINCIFFISSPVSLCLFSVARADVEACRYAPVISFGGAQRSVLPLLPSDTYLPSERCAAMRPTTHPESGKRYSASNIYRLFHPKAVKIRRVCGRTAQSGGLWQKYIEKPRAGKG